MPTMTSTSNIKAILFDKEGTLTSSHPDGVFALTDLNTLIKRLKAHDCVLGIATHDREDITRKEFALMGIHQHFDFIAGIESGYGQKPDGDMLTAFSECVDISPQNICVVGDSMLDMEMAKNGKAGLIIGVLTGASAKRELSTLADVTLDTVADVPAYVYSH